MAEAGKETQEGEQPKKGKLKLIIIIVVVLALLGGGAFFFLGGSGEGEELEEHEVEHHFTLVPLKTFYVNLAQSGSYLKITLTMRVDTTILEQALESEEHGGHGGGHGGSGGGDSAEAEIPHHVSERIPMLRDAILTLLSSKAAEEVLSREGKELLKEELIEVINEALELEEGPVVDIFFNEFLVQ